jgi:hypothetical protein
MGSGANRIKLFCCKFTRSFLKALFTQHRKNGYIDALVYLTKSMCKFTPKKFYEIDPWGQCYKMFHVRNLRIFIISYGVCPWQAFPALSNVCRQGQEPTLDWST